MGERMPSLDSIRKSDSDSEEPLWHSIPLDDVFSNLNTTVDGLSTEDVIRRRETYGKNKLEGKKVRVISMPCWEIFNLQSDEYKKELIPERGNLKVSIEAGITSGWGKYIGSNGLAIGIDHFGSSAPATDLATKFGFTADQVINKIETYLKELL